MKKIINISMVILVCALIVFGTWKDKEALKYNQENSPPQSQLCFYDIVESLLGGVVFIWAGTNLLLIPSGLDKLFNKAKSPIQKFYGKIFMRCCGLIMLALGLLSFWNIYVSNLPNCHGL